MEIGENIDWSIELEEYIKNISEKAMCYGILHKRSQEKYSKICLYIDIPVIILSTISGSLNIGSEQIFQGLGNSNLIIGGLSIFVAIISTLSSYFSWKERMESHKYSYLNYMKLNRFINIELSLKRSERIVVKDLIKIIRSEYERLMENSPIIDNDIISDFKKKYQNYKDIVSFPIECNGLEPTFRYNEDNNSVIINRINLEEVLHETRRNTEDNEIIEENNII